MNNKRRKMTGQDQREFSDMIGRAIAGNSRLTDGTTLLQKYPEKYTSPFTDWMALLIAEVKARQSLERQKQG